MSLRPTRRGMLRLLMVTAILILAGAWSSAKEPGEQPIGWSKIRAANAPIKPIYASEIAKEAEEAKAEVDKMAEDLSKVQVDPEADSVEKAWPGSISLAQHRADIAKLRDKFMLCTAAMQDKIREKEDSKTATPADRAQFKKCMEHCKAILNTMDQMHYNSSVLTTATKKIYFLEGMEKHKKIMAQLQQQMKDCPMMMKETLACCEVKDKGMEQKKVEGMDHGNMPGMNHGKSSSKETK